MARKIDPVQRIVDAAMALAAEKGWRTTTLADIAERAGMSLAEFYRHVSGRADIIAALSRLTDAKVLGGGVDMEERPRDRLFDVLMRRFDALAPYKEGLRAIWTEARMDPLTALSGLPHLKRSMGWMLEAAGVHSSGFAGMVQVRGLAAVWLSVLDTWFQDDSEDLAKTMAALDSRLRQAEELWASVRRPFGAFRRPEAPAA